MIGCGTLMVAGLVTFFIVRKKAFFRLEPNHTEGANRAAFRPWGVILTRVIACVMIGVYGGIYLGYAIDKGYGWLSLLHVFPAVAAIITVIVVSKKTSRKAVPLAVTASGAAEQTGYAQSAQSFEDPRFGDQYAPPADYGDKFAPTDDGKQYAPPEGYGEQFAPSAPVSAGKPGESPAPVETDMPGVPAEPTDPVEPAAPTEPPATPGDLWDGQQ